MAQTSTISEAEILEEILADTGQSLTPEAARSLVSLKFSRAAKAQIRRLLRKNNQGRISPEERITLENYLRVGQFLDLLQARAKLLLAQSSELS
jgi:hypothetical protein